MKKVEDREYLRLTLESNKLKKKELETAHRINIAVFNENIKYLTEAIYSIEGQLSDS